MGVGGIVEERDPATLVQPAATRVRDPVSRRSVWLAGVVKSPRVEDGALRYDLVFDEGHTAAHRAGIAAEVEQNLRAEGWEGRVEPRVVEPAAKRPSTPLRGMEARGVQPHGGPITRVELPGVKHVIAVASGKGGVGKSTISTNLAVGLRALGARVGLLDADVHGPSLPQMMGVRARPMVDDQRRIQPVEAHGVRCLSMGLLVDPKEAIIWRGPMVMQFLNQSLRDTDWGELDVLVVDMPPGTGDAQLTLVQTVALAGAVVVTTPQPVALADAERGITMFEKLGVPLLGLVENMAYYPLPDGTIDWVFGRHGGKRTAAAHGVDLIGQVPLNTGLRQSADEGCPAVLGSGPVADALRGIAAEVATRLGIEVGR